MIRRRLMAGLAAMLTVAAQAAAPSQAEALSLEIERYVQTLASAERMRELGLASVRRPAGIVNRLDIVFEDSVPAEQRAAVLQQIGQEFLRVLFERDLIPTVSVVERDSSGRIINRAVVRVGARLGLPRRVASC